MLLLISPVRISVAFRAFLLLILFATMTFAAGTLMWPLSSDSIALEVITSHGEHMKTMYRGIDLDNYIHDGIDIRAYPGEPVINIEEGRVIAVRTTNTDSVSGKYYWHIAIQPFRDTAHVWVYAHIDSKKVRVKTGDTIDAGDTIATIVEWMNDFHHLHFGLYSYRDHPTELFLEAMCNPLLLLRPLKDPIPPEFHSSYSGKKWIFRQSTGSDTISPARLEGVVNVSVGIRDSTTKPNVLTGIYALSYYVNNEQGNRIKEEYEG